MYSEEFPLTWEWRSDGCHPRKLQIKRLRSYVAYESSVNNCGAEWEASSLGQGQPEQLCREPVPSYNFWRALRGPGYGFCLNERAADLEGWWQTGSGARGHDLNLRHALKGRYIDIQGT